MKNLSILVLLGLILLANCGGLWLDSQNAQFLRKTEQWNSFKIPAQGGSGIYDYRYYDLPAGWDYKNDDILIPTNYKTSRYQIKVVAYDILYRVSITKYAIIQLKANDTKYFSVYLRDSYDNGYNVAYRYKIDDRKLYQYPSWNKIDLLIQQGDVAELEGIIMKTIDSDNSCDDKKQFLTGVLSRIQRFLESYSSGIEDLNLQNLELTSKINAILKEIASIEKSVDLNIAALTRELNNVQSRIVWYQKQIQDGQSDIQQYTKNKQLSVKKIWEIKDVIIPSLEKQIWQLKKKLDWIRKSSGYTKYSYSYYSKNYYNSQQNLVEDTIRRKQAQLNEYKTEVNSLQLKVEWFEKKIKELVSLKSEAEKAITSLESQKAALKLKISNAKYDKEAVLKIQQLKREIKSLQSIISKNKWEIKVSLAASKILQESLQKIRMDADKVYYACEDVKIQEVTIVQNYFQVVVAPTVFYSYVQNGYGVNINTITIGGNLRINSYQTYSKVSIIRCNVYASEWTIAYGRSYLPIQYRYGSSLFTNEFICRKSSNNWGGRIKRISGNSIYAQIGGVQHNLRLGPCTTLETSTGYRIPRVNDYIIWTGTVSPLPNTYDVHSGICI